MGPDFDTRGARVDEAIDACRRLWTDEVIEHHGTFFDFGPTAFESKPVQRPLALHTGGDGAAALRRAATVGTGWVPVNHGLADLPGPGIRLRELAQSAGRAGPIEITLGADVATLDDLAGYARTGVTSLIVRPWTSSREAVDGMRRFADSLLR
jgi:alkanesulfonate monooxygenase SsuD/methylene tetrahydromethanopterin reductase-like flavin-dependent oxidoreductase (luciferase family)